MRTKSPYLVKTKTALRRKNLVSTTVGGPNFIPANDLEYPQKIAFFEISGACGLSGAIWAALGMLVGVQFMLV